MSVCITSWRGHLPLLAAASICCAVSGADFSVNPNKTVVLGSGGVAGGPPCGTTSFTQSLDSVTITQFNSISCNAGGLHTDNSYYRLFDASAWGGSALTVCAVQVGIESANGAGGTQPIECRLYDTNDINSLGAAVASVSISVPDQDLSLFDIPIAGSVSTGLVVEIFTPDGQTAGNSFFIGSNGLGETGPSYLAAADCGVNAPTPTGALGFPEMQIVMTVFGDAGCVIGNCPGDTNDDGVVDVTDLVNVIGGWGTDGLGQPGAIADLNCDGVVDVIDLIQVISGWGFCPAKNDECEDRIALGNGDTPYTNFGATTNASDPAFDCGFQVGSDIWYNYTATCGGELTISVCDSNFDTVLEVYDGVDCPPTDSLACNDDFCDLQSEITLLVLEGDQLKIRIGGWQGDQGTGTLSISCTTIVCGPGAGGCFEANGTPGCDDVACCELICTLDAFCCDTAWDAICADEAIANCATEPQACCFEDGSCQDLQPTDCLAGGGDLQGIGSACATATCMDQTGACCFPDASCQDLLPTPCDAAGGVHQGAGTGCATFTCEAICGGPNAGSCTEANGTPGCDDAECCTSVCAIDAFCCDVEWDAVCADEAVICDPTPGACCIGLLGECQELSGADCLAAGGTFQGPGTSCDPNPCIAICGPGAGGCFEANGTPGCEDVQCCELVCSLDAFCCDVEWDSMCADDALVTCATKPQACCFEDGTCQNLLPADCIVGGGALQGIGSTCTTVTCVNQTGACCFSDGSCQDLLPTPCAAAGGTHQGAGSGCATTVCDVACGPGAGSCTEANGTPGCEDVACCNLVCSLDVFCCEVAWDGACVDEAAENCSTAPVACCFPSGGCQDLAPGDCAASGGSAQGSGTTCGSVVCIPTCGPGAGDCTVPNGTPGCDDVTCCELICGQDAFCCETEWDMLCANAALKACAFGPGACCFSDGSCQDLTTEACATAVGDFQGPGTTCATTSCPF